MEIRRLLHDIEYNEHKPAIKVLIDNDYTKEIRIAFKHFQHMKEHKTAFPIAVQIVTGCIEFGVAGTPHKLNTGDLITLPADIPHDLIALEDSIVRLTLHKGDSLDRVKKVIHNS